MNFLTSFFKNSTKSADTDLNKILRNCIVALVIFSICIFVIIIYIKVDTGVTPQLTFLSVAGACVLGGSAAGFLFGIPRSEKYRFKSDADHASKDYYYSDNTNLEEISDWLTKIIVGLTLVKFRTILDWMHQASISISKTLTGNANCEDKCTQFYVFSYAIIILYVIAGASIAYLWTRINFSKILTNNIMDQRDIVTSRQQQTAGLKTLNPQLVVSNEVGELRPMISENISEFKVKVDREYKGRGVVDKSDLQKGRWGGKAESNGYMLDADVKKQFIPGLFSLTLKVMSLDPKNPLQGTVAIFLHDTFPQQIVYVQAVQGMALLEITTYESFTVGAYLENETTLELDLNNVPGYPKGFYWGK